MELYPIDVGLKRSKKLAAAWGFGICAVGMLFVAGEQQAHRCISGSSTTSRKLVRVRYKSSGAELMSKKSVLQPNIK
ncbi:MAG: hypothetical protein ACT6FB_02125 [Methanosarcinaceae archaeon]